MYCLFTKTSCVSIHATWHRNSQAVIEWNRGEVNEKCYNRINRLHGLTIGFDKLGFFLLLFDRIWKRPPIRKVDISDSRWWFFTLFCMDPYIYIYIFLICWILLLKTYFIFSNNVIHLHPKFHENKNLW